MSITLLSMSKTCERTSLSRTSINRHREKGNFPEPVRVSEDRIAFVESEIEEWIAQRIAERNSNREISA